MQREVGRTRRGAQQKQFGELLSRGMSETDLADMKTLMPKPIKRPENQSKSSRQIPKPFWNWQYHTPLYIGEEQD